MDNRLGSPIYQTGVTSEVIKNRRIEGTLPIRDLLQRGNFGIGTTHLLVGELVFYKGKAFYITPKGHCSEYSEDALVPFAVVTHLTSDETTHTEKEMSYNELCNVILDLLHVKNIPYAICIEGYFKKITVRSLKGVLHQEKIDLSNMDENLYTYTNVHGAMVGYFFPDYLTALTSVGFHFHFIDEEKTWGGHLYDAQPLDIKITVQMASEFTVGFAPF